MNLLAFFSMPGGTELIVILVIALLIFGRRLPEVSRSIGKSIVEFKKGMQDMREQVETPLPDAKPPQIQSSTPPAAATTTSPTQTSANENSNPPVAR